MKENLTVAKNMVKESNIIQIEIVMKDDLNQVNLKGKVPSSMQMVTNTKVIGYKVKSKAKEHFTMLQEIIIKVIG